MEGHVLIASLVYMWPTALHLGLSGSIGQATHSQHLMGLIQWFF